MDQKGSTALRHVYWDEETMLTYRSLKDIVYEYISNQITSGKIQPNQSINEAEICRDLKISRTPVREALMQLSHEGYIEHVPRRGFFTHELTVERVRNIYTIIGNLEALGAVLAVDNRDHLDLKRLHQLVEEMEQAVQERHYDLYNQLQNTFHQTINQASKNEDLIRLIAYLKKILMQQQYIYEASKIDIHSIFLQMIHEHRHIIKLLEEGDKEALRTFLCEVHWNPRYATFHTYI